MDGGTFLLNNALDLDIKVIQGLFDGHGEEGLDLPHEQGVQCTQVSWFGRSNMQGANALAFVMEGGDQD